MFVRGKPLQPSIKFARKPRSLFEWRTFHVHSWIGSGLTRKNQARLERLTKDKHSNLFEPFVSCKEKVYKIVKLSFRLI